MTYLFDGSILSAYFQSNGTAYDVKTLDTAGNLVTMDGGLARKRKAELAELITIVDCPKLNAIGTPKNKEQPLSSNWMGLDAKLKDDRLLKLKNSTYNFFFNHAAGGSSVNMWATLKAHRTALKGKGYSRGFTPVNLKATNKYMDRKNLAYLVNVFMRPRLLKYFAGCGVVPNEELYAISQLVQWVWRSQIRVGKPIVLYLPSQRMRELFKDWLADEINQKLIPRAA